MKYALVGLICTIASATMSFAATMALYGTASESDFLVATTSYYFKEMSEAGASPAAMFSDCHVELAEAGSGDPESRVGLCTTEDARSKYFYMIALSFNARYLYSDFQKIPR